MATDPPVHRTETLTTPAGDQADIDTEMVPVIRALWGLGLTTTACCQDVGEAVAGIRAQRETPLGYGGDGFIAYHHGYALLKLPVPEAQRLVEMLAGTEAFGEWMRHPWRPGSWRMHIPLTAEGSAPEALLHFSRSQIALLTDVLRGAIRVSHR
ncbi:hypothetical protein AB0P17_28045 [Streptomyces sp. NPDC088124]|uniref:hypothetical protein n=1 Tax=Streptomyces sp. NPDC088124 TaxID=3154654 RepID=UPI003433EA62